MLAACLHRQFEPAGNRGGTQPVERPKPDRHHIADGGNATDGLFVLFTAAVALAGGFADLQWMNTDMAPGQVAMAVRKGDTELLDRVNISLAKLIANGTVREIYNRYGAPWGL